MIHINLPTGLIERAQLRKNYDRPLNVIACLQAYFLKLIFNIETVNRMTSDKDQAWAIGKTHSCNGQGLEALNRVQSNILSYSRSFMATPSLVPCIGVSSTCDYPALHGDFLPTQSITRPKARLYCLRSPDFKMSCYLSQTMFLCNNLSQSITAKNILALEAYDSCLDAQFTHFFLFDFFY